MTSLNDLNAFCYYLVHKYGNPDSVTEDQKADEFRKMYFRNSLVTIKEIRAAAVCCNIKLGALDTMPANLRGYHDVYDDNQTIYYKNGDALSGIENTILHEVREMMEPHFVKLCPSYKSLDNSSLHNAANRFASAVLLPGESFTRKLYETGLDLFELVNYYKKSCSQVLLRMGEVLNGKHFFYGALYEFELDEDKWSLNYCTLSPSLFPEPDLRELGDFFPSKGSTVIPGSIIDRVIKERKACLGQIFTLLDGPPKKGKKREGLLVLARPIFLSGILSKVFLIVVFGRDKNLLNPQINRVNPEIIKGSLSSLC